MVRPVICIPAYEADEGFGPVNFGARAAADGSGGSTVGSCGGVKKAFSKVPSLLFDLEDLEEGSCHKQGADQPHDPALCNVLGSMSSLLEPWNEAEYMLLVHVRLVREHAAKRGCPLVLPDLADTLRRLGYTIKIRTALGGGYGGACLRNLRHTFLTVDLSTQGGTSHVQYILDPKFREQFEVAHPTPRYRKVMEGVGQEVLATPDRLTRVVELLCHEMARAFAETSTPLPPWRQVAAMLSKWSPRRSEDRDVLPCPDSYLNNALGIMATAAAPWSSGTGLPPHYKPAVPTVAQRMAALGPAPSISAPPAGPSPIPEGVEGEGQLSLPSGGSSLRTADSTADSLYVGWPLGSPEERQDEDDAVGPQMLPPATLDMLAQRHPTTTTLPRRLHEHTSKGGGNVWEGIKQVAAGLPRPRHLSWA